MCLRERKISIPFSELRHKLLWTFRLYYFITLRFFLSSHHRRKLLFWRTVHEDSSERPMFSRLTPFLCDVWKTNKIIEYDMCLWLDASDNKLNEILRWTRPCPWNALYSGALSVNTSVAWNHSFVSYAPIIRNWIITIFYSEWLLMHFNMR